jgi:xylulokinase
MARLIGLDVGTSSLKGLAIDENGALLGEAEQGYAFATPRPGWAEQDPELWWQAAQAVLEALDAPRADGIGLTGQMHGLVALGADDRPLRPAILWSSASASPGCSSSAATARSPASPRRSCSGSPSTSRRSTRGSAG